MNGGKRFAITLAAGLCTAGLVAGLGRLSVQQSLPEHTPGNIVAQEHAVQPETTEHTDAVSIRIGEDVFLSAVTETLHGQLEISELTAEIGAEQTVTLRGTVSRDAIVTLLESQADEIAAAYRAVATLLPEQLPFTLEIGLQASDGAVAVVPKHFQIEKMEIPETFIEENLFDTLAQAINREVSKQLSDVQSIVSEDGGLRLDGTPRTNSNA